MAYIKKKRKEKAVNIDFTFQLNTNLVKLRKILWETPVPESLFW